MQQESSSARASSIARDWYHLGRVTTLQEVREKIERRYSTALGQAELASTSVEGRMLEVKKATLNMAGQSRLEEIRASLGQSTGTSAASKPAAAVETNQHPAIDDAPPPTSKQTEQPAAQPAENQN